MATDRIDFISAYCDRWCERCAFTERCAVYACTVATAMCDGDLAAGLELAVGVPQSVSGDRETSAGEKWLADYEEPSADELDAAMRDEDARRERIEALEISRLSWNYMMTAHEWLERRDRRPQPADALLREALDIVGWDSTLVGSKLHRALLGRDRGAPDSWPETDAVQNDANGSAKVALISLERSETAWRVIADATQDAAAADLAALAATLRARVADEFPDAMAFVRPGFDEPWR